LLHPVDFRTENNAQKMPCLLCIEKCESGCCSWFGDNKTIS